MPQHRFPVPQWGEGVIRLLTITLVLILALTVTSAGSAHAYQPPPRWLAKLIHQTFPGDERRATCIAYAESRYKPRADNGISYGLFQIHQGTWDWKRNRRAVPVVGKVDWKRIYEPAYNARVARRIYLHAGGWGPWVTRGGCGG